MLSLDAESRDVTHLSGVSSAPLTIKSARSSTKRLNVMSPLLCLALIFRIISSIIGFFSWKPKVCMESTNSAREISPGKHREASDDEQARADAVMPLDRGEMSYCSLICLLHVRVAQFRLQYSTLVFEVHKSTCAQGFDIRK